jgi:hypothetical protein
MKQLLAVLAIALSLLAVGYRATHHPVYGKCHTTADGQVCTLLKWEVNK